MLSFIHMPPSLDFHDPPSLDFFALNSQWIYFYVFLLKR